MPLWTVGAGVEANLCSAAWAVENFNKGSCGTCESYIHSVLLVAFNTPTWLTRLRVLCLLRPPSARRTGVSSSLCLLASQGPRELDIGWWVRLLPGSLFLTSRLCWAPPFTLVTSVPSPFLTVTSQRVPSSFRSLYTQKMFKW